MLSAGVCLGTGFLFRMNAARHSSGSNSKSAGKSGKVRPSRIRRLMRQAMTMYSAKAVCSRSVSLSCSRSTRQPSLSTKKNSSISHRARYQLTSSTASCSVEATRLVSSRQTTGLAPAGALTSDAIRQVTSSSPPWRSGSRTRWTRTSCSTARALRPRPAGISKRICPSGAPAMTSSHSLPPSGSTRLCWQRTR